MKRFAMMCCFLLALSVAAGATIVKTALPCKTGLCLYWWPKLPHLAGWHRDQGASLHYAVNALAPNGSTFVNAQAVMYAKADYKPRVPNIKSLKMFIANDRREFLAAQPGIVVKEVGDVVTGDGRKMPSFTFFPRSAAAQGNWEQVSYGQEGKFYLVFTSSARSKGAFEKARGAYYRLIGSYRAKL